MRRWEIALSLSMLLQWMLYAIAGCGGSDAIATRHLVAKSVNPGIVLSSGFRSCDELERSMSSRGVLNYDTIMAESAVERFLTTIEQLRPLSCHEPGDVHFLICIEVVNLVSQTSDTIKIGWISYPIIEVEDRTKCRDEMLTWSPSRTYVVFHGEVLLGDSVFTQQLLSLFPDDYKTELDSLADFISEE